MLELIVKKYGQSNIFAVAMIDLEENELPNLNLGRVPALFLYSLK
jgi:hypothetical protein